MGDERRGWMEFVYVVKRYDLFNMSFPHGFIPADDAVAGNLPEN